MLGAVAIPFGGCDDPARLIWGVFLRLLGVVWFIAFAGLYPQLTLLHKLWPTDAWLTAVIRDDDAAAVAPPATTSDSATNDSAATPPPSATPAPTVKPVRSFAASLLLWLDRLRDYPTYAWFLPTRTYGAEIARAHCLIGAAAALLLTVGVAPPIGGVSVSFICVVLCWSLWLSLMTCYSSFLSFPWDMLLAESGFLALFLPALGGGLCMSAAPHAVVGWSFRVLLARVMLGFGKRKFWGSAPGGGGWWWHHKLYIKYFCLAQPMPHRAAWYLHRLPDALQFVSLLVMFVVECVMPFGLFFGPEYVQLFAAVSIAGLMAGIGVSGCFGIFNALTAVLCVTALDTSLPPVSVWSIGSFGEWWALWRGSGWGGAVLLLWHVSGCLCFKWCNWTQAWIRTEIVKYPPLCWFGIRYIVSFVRAIYSWQLIHSYGIFPVATPPPIRGCAVFDVQHPITLHWHSYEWRHSPSAVTSPLSWYLPVQPRLDFLAVYVPLNLRLDELFAWNRYATGSKHWSLRLVQLLLADDPDARALFRCDPFTVAASAAPPRGAFPTGGTASADSKSHDLAPATNGERVRGTQMRVRCVYYRFTTPIERLAARERDPNAPSQWWIRAAEVNDVCDAEYRWLKRDDAVWTVTALPTNEFTAIMFGMM